MRDCKKERRNKKCAMNVTYKCATLDVHIQM